MRKLVSSRLAALSPPEVASAAAAAGGAALALRGWWEEVNESPAWQDGAFFSLSVAYALVSTVALRQDCPRCCPQTSQSTFGTVAG